MEKPRNNADFFRQKEHFDKSGCFLLGTYPDTPKQNDVVLPFSYTVEAPLCHLSNLAHVDEGVLSYGKRYSSVEHAIVSKLFNNNDIFDHGSRFDFRTFYKSVFNFEGNDRGVNAFIRALEKSAVTANNMVGFLPMMVSKYTGVSFEGSEKVLKKLGLVRGGSVNDVDMLRMLRSKFKDPFMRAVLLSTRDAYLVCEGAADGFFTAKYTRSKFDPQWEEKVKGGEKTYGYKDTDVRFPNFSFRGKTVGTNALGKYLMFIRNEIYRELKLYRIVSPLDKLSLRLSLTTFLLATGQPMVTGANVETAEFLQTKNEAAMDAEVDAILSLHTVSSSDETVVFLKTEMPSIMNVYTKLANCYANFSVSRGWISDFKRIKDRDKFRLGVENLLVLVNRVNENRVMLNENFEMYFEKQPFFDVVLKNKFGALNGMAKVATLTNKKVDFKNFETKDQLRDALSAFYIYRGDGRTKELLDVIVEKFFHHQYNLEQKLVEKYGEGMHTLPTVNVPRTIFSDNSRKTLSKASHTTQHKVSHTAQYKASHTAQPDASHTAQHKASHTAQPDASHTAQPDASHNAQPKAVPMSYSKSTKRVCSKKRRPIGSKRLSV